MSFLKKETNNITKDGPVIDVTIYPDINTIQKLLKEGQYPLPSSRIVALIDTGASSTCINKQLLTDLKLQERDVTTVYTPNGKTEQPLYDICLSIPNSLDALMNLQVLGANLEGQPYGALIGRDVLKKCTFIYNGWDESYFLLPQEN